MDCKNPMVAVFDEYLGKYRFVGAVHTLKSQPVYLHDSSRKVVYLPCGQCYACRIARSRDWATRCVLEARAFGDNNSFITLTYDPEYMPSDMSLHKEDFQKFMKRLRKNSGKKIRYYMCGEYGELHNRPHFHACLFGYKPDDLYVWSIHDGIKLYRSPFLEKCWPLGFVTVGDVTYESAAYVARYVLKKKTGLIAEEHYNGRLPEYTNMSLKPGIGQTYFEKYSEEIYNRDFVVIRDGIKAKVPRYFDSIYDRYYGEGAFDTFIKPKRALASNFKFKKMPIEFTLRRVIDRAQAKEVAAKQKLRRKLEEAL